VNILWLIFVIVSLLAATGAFVWLVLTIQKGGLGGGNSNADHIAAAHEDVERIFNDEFREELRNRGRLHFEKIINDNAMFLQQDLQLTASDLNEFMQGEIKKVLKEEFGKYQESVESAKELAVEALQKTQETVEQQRAELAQKLHEELVNEKKMLLEKFEENMGQVVNHYILEAIGGELDISDQMEYIYQHLEDNKQAILEDIVSGS
jgi:vacuolar-type H+-ATPase subunit I/STV1